ncbi:hypothetical protein J437_LFUL018956 [Ladona fulva]|uniref:Matrin-type domain-containing protein n=1 Tax=Ladona fulva TaxID=123851 RepID=A0A8K0P3G6_LADFU|nr:hypothetical protein J437_LFUL018956 [Ladona fulva]
MITKFPFADPFTSHPNTFAQCGVFIFPVWTCRFSAGFKRKPDTNRSRSARIPCFAPVQFSGQHLEQISQLFCFCFADQEEDILILKKMGDYYGVAHLIADILSVLTITLCLVLKVPQILNLIKVKSAKGLSMNGLMLELSSYSVMASYNYCNGYALLSYMEYPIIIFQEIILIYLVLKYMDLLNAVSAGLFGLYLAVFGGFLFGIIPPQILTFLVPLCTPVSASSKVVQLLAILRAKDSTSISITTWCLSAFTNLNHTKNMDFQNRPGGKTGGGGVASWSETNRDRRERLRQLALETIDLNKDPYFMKNHLGSYECKLCLTLHNNEGSYLAHTQGKKHQANLARRAAKEAKESPAQPAPEKPRVEPKKFVKIGRPGYRVTKQRDQETGQQTRVYTIFMDSADLNLLGNFGISVLLSSSIVAAALYYRNPQEKEKAQ